MHSRDYPRTSLPQLEPWAEPPSASRRALRARMHLARIRRRADPWLAFAVVLLAGWASWFASTWLVERWQFF